jgi:hypothetical protein
MPAPGGGQRMEHNWDVHQVQTTVNFAPKNRVLSWLFGGLNFQVEHHLCHRICHVHYPALSKVVEETCRESGVRRAACKTFFSGVASHFRWLRRMGRPTAGLHIVGWNSANLRPVSVLERITQVGPLRDPTSLTPRAPLTLLSRTRPPPVLHDALAPLHSGFTGVQQWQRSTHGFLRSRRCGSAA